MPHTLISIATDTIVVAGATLDMESFILFAILFVLACALSLPVERDLNWMTEKPRNRDPAPL